MHMVRKITLSLGTPIVGWASQTDFSPMRSDGHWVVVDANTATRSVGATDGP